MGDEVAVKPCGLEVQGKDASASPVYVLSISLVVALGGFLFGYDWVVIGGAKPFYEVYFHLTSASSQGWAMSCALLGCLIGSILSGVLSESLGRKPSLLIAAFIFILSSLCIGFATTFSAFVAWRMAGGVAIGLTSGLSPVYIAEVAPAGIRGKLVGLNDLANVLGILSAQVVNWSIARPITDTSAAAVLMSWNGQRGWRWMFTAAAVPAMAFLLGMFFVPESPRWLALRGRLREAARVLERIGGLSHAQFVLEEIKSSGRRTNTRNEVLQLLRLPFRRILILSIVMAVLQQWCGVNVIFNYAQEIFADAGYTLSSILFNILLTGIVLVLFTFLAIATIDRVGRRPLMLFGCAGLVLIHGVLGTLYYRHSHGLPMLCLVVAAIACYALTLAPVTWVVLAEIFPGPVRGTGMAIATASLWIACFLLTYTFPLLNRALGTAGNLWIYGAICAVGFVFLYRWLPETRQKSLEEIEASWATNRSS